MLGKSILKDYRIDCSVTSAYINLVHFRVDNVRAKCSEIYYQPWRVRQSGRSMHQTIIITHILHTYYLILTMTNQ